MTEVHGDRDLAVRLRTALGRRHDVAAVAAVSGEDSRVASLGTGLAADYEIGSISKAITGLLYAEALARGEVDASTTLGDLLPVADTAVARVTLAALSTHRSGLPGLPKSAAPLRRALELWRHGTNPYGEDVHELLDQARGVRVGRPAPRYSNFGFELLGHALARAAGVAYPELVRQRLVEPLGLSTLYAPSAVDELRPTARSGRSRRGRLRAPWTGAAIAPAGGLRASIADMARLTQALLDGTAPGIAALDPVAPFSGRGVTIGAAWITLTHQNHQITWHNGGTGGFRSWIGLDRQEGTGVVLLSATSAPVDPHGFRMLRDLTDRQS